LRSLASWRRSPDEEPAGEAYGLDCANSHHSAYRSIIGRGRTDQCTRGGLMLGAGGRRKFRVKRSDPLHWAAFHGTVEMCGICCVTALCWRRQEQQVNGTRWVGAYGLNNGWRRDAETTKYCRGTSPGGGRTCPDVEETESSVGGAGSGTNLV